MSRPGGTGPPEVPAVSGTIFDIQRFSVHDGPGIRTLVFLKGCPLACRWCSNPESQRPEPDLLYDSGKCVACGGCVAACPNGALWLEEGRLRFDRERCAVCGRCVEACAAEARTVAGRQVTAEAVVAEVLKDAPFYAQSGGGVTLGGGEPLAQPEFARAVLRGCRQAGLHTAVETCGRVPWASLEAVRSWTDLFLYDLKHVDPERHRAGTGGEVGVVLANLARLVGSGARVEVRTPVVPGFNDDPDTLRGLATRVAGLGLREIHLLPFHRLGQPKYRHLGRPAAWGGENGIPDARLRALADAAEACGIRAVVGR